MGLEFEAGIETTYQNGVEVRAVHDFFQILLAGGDDPNLALAFVADHFGEAVQLADFFV